MSHQGTPLRPPEPYYMCTERECQERISCGQVNVLESSTKQTTNRPTKLDPYRAVAKYYRSAAGGGGASRYALRSPQQLAFTVDYLLYEILANHSQAQAQAQRTHSNQQQQQQQQQQGPSDSFLETIRFVEDRIRAVQVEWTKQQCATNYQQYILIKAHIFILYLVSDCHKYEHTFGTTALQTALSSYWNSTSHSDSNHDGSSSTLTHKNTQTGTLIPTRQQMDDEVLALTSLQHLSKALLIQQQQQQQQSHDNTNHDSSLAASVLALYRKHIRTKPDTPLVLFQWVLVRVIVPVELGHWWTALQALAPSHDQTTVHSDKSGLPTSFVILARCCMAPSLSYMRWNAVQAYNVSFAKREALSLSNVAQLLCMYRSCSDAETNKRSNSIWDDEDYGGTNKKPPPPPPVEEDPSLLFTYEPEAARRFGKLVGLPESEDGQSLLFKANALEALPASSSHKGPPRNQQRVLPFIRDDDAFVLGPIGKQELFMDHQGIPCVEWIRTLIYSRDAS